MNAAGKSILALNCTTPHLVMALAAVFGACAPVFGQQLPVEDPRAFLMATWKAQRSEIVTAQFEVDYYMYAGPNSGKKVTRETLQPLLASADLARIPEFFKKLASAVGKPEGRAGDTWPVRIDIMEEGVKFQNIRYDAGPGKPASKSVFDGTKESQYDPQNRQASVFVGRSGISALMSSNLRYVPFVKSGKRAEDYEVLSRTGGTVRLKAGDWTFTADEKTGFVHHSILHYPKNAVLSETYQYGPRETPEGIVFPTISASLQYLEGAVYLLELYHIKKAIFNSELPPGTFVVEAPKGTNVLDYQENRSSPSSRVATSPVADVAQFPNATTGRFARKLRPWYLVGGVGVLGVLCVVVGYRLWRSRKASP